MKTPWWKCICFFNQAALQVTTHFNKFLQQEDPLIVVIVEHFLKNVFGKFDTLSAIKSATDITLVDYSRNNQLPGIIIFYYYKIWVLFIIILADKLGITARQLLKKSEEEGDISPEKVKAFFQAVCTFYTTAADYAWKNLPLSDSVLKNAGTVNFEARETSLFTQVELFLNRYS